MLLRDSSDVSFVSQIASFVTHNEKTVSPCYNVGAVQDDLERVKKAGNGRVDITVGSALDIFGGVLPYGEVLAWHNQQKSPMPAELVAA